MRLTKREVQSRILHQGKKIALKDFEWDNNTFSSKLTYLVLDFYDIDGVVFKTGSYCTFNTGSYCTFNTGFNCTFNTNHSCTFDTGSDCTFTTSHFCTFTTSHSCTFTTSHSCTFNTGFNCTFTTSHSCTFNTGSYCTFNTGSYCTFNTGSYCTFTTGAECVIIRRDVFTVIQPEEGQVIQLFPSSQEGYLVNGLYNDKPHIIADGIVSEILSHKGNTYKVWDLGEDKPSFLVTDGNGNYAHGESLRDAQEDLVFKVVAKFDGDLPETAAGTEWVGIYRAVTGACSKGVKDFVLSIDMPFDAVYSAKEIIKLTEGKFGHEAFRAKYERGVTNYVK